MASLTGITQGQGQTLVSTYVVNPQTIAAGNAYHLTVPPRYVELGDMRKAMNLEGTFGKGALGARDAYMHRFYPEIDDNNWNDQSHEIASQTNFADYSMARRLTLIKQQEEAEGNETTCPLFTWTWSDAHSGPTPYLQATVLSRTLLLQFILHMIHCHTKLAFFESMIRPSPCE